MKSLIFSTLLLVAVTATKSKELEKGPQTFTNSDVNAPATPDSSQKQQKRLATKEIIMYLTPTQIKNLQSGLAYITSQPLAKQDGLTGSKQDREYLYNIRNPNEDRKELENLQALKKISETQEENIFNPLSQNKQEPQLIYPDLERLKANAQLLGQKEKELAIPSLPWIPNSPIEPQPISINKYQELLLNKQNKEEWNPILDFDRANSKILPLLQPLNIFSQEKRLPLNYGSSYNNQKNFEKLDLELQYRNEVAKQKALAEMEAILLQNQGIKHSLPTPSYEHIAVPLSFFSLNSKPLYEKKATPLPTSPFYFSSKNIDKQRF